MIQRQPTPWSCLSTSFAIVLGVEVASLHSEIGHDGSKIIYPDLEEPAKRRAFHIQEMIDLCERRGLAVVQFDAVPIATVGLREYETYTPERNAERFNYLLNKYTGVLTGKNPSGRPHAVCWDGFTVVDPALGSHAAIERYTIDTFYAVLRAEHLREKF